MQKHHTVGTAMRVKVVLLYLLGLLVIHAVQSASNQQACTDTNFQQILAKATKLIGRRPTYKCARSVFDKVCNKCVHDFTCYVSEGKRVATQIPSCEISNQYINTEVKVMDESFAFDTFDDCNDNEFYSRLTAKAAMVTGHRLPEKCSRDVYTKICGICGRDFSCYMEQGRNVAMNIDSCTAPQNTLSDEAALFHYLDAIDRHEKRSKLGHLLAMSHDEEFGYHAVAINDENDVGSKSWIEPTPTQAKGPFYPVSFPDDTNTDLTTVDNVRYAKGIQVYIQGQVMDAKTGKPIENATVEIWQACKYGKYDHPQDPNPAPADPNFQYYGKDSTTATGKYVFKTIIPGAYPATDDWLRPPHIHYLIKSPKHKDLITQMYFHPNTLSPTEGLNYEYTQSEIGNKPRVPRKGPGFLQVVNKHDNVLARLSESDRKRLTVLFKSRKQFETRVGVFNIYLDPKE